jgi:RHS repeat-associated protein
MDRPDVVSNSDRHKDAAGERTDTDYDDAGRPIRVTKPKGLATTGLDFATEYAYDKLDRVIRQTVYGTSSTQKRITHACYDVAGDLRSVTSPRALRDTVTCPATGVPNTSTYDYDDAHRVKVAKDALGHATRYEYDFNGNVTAVEKDIATGRVQRTATDYDQRDMPVETRERLTATRQVVTKIEYDKNGNRKRVVSPRGYDTAGGSGTYSSYVTGYDYDALDRLTRISLPFGPQETERQYVHRSYDANGNLAWTSLPVTTATADAVGAGAKTTMTYFDPGWIRTSDDPPSPLVRFDYTAQGWQAARTPDAPGPGGDGAMSWTYFDDGQLRTRSDQGGQPSTYDYDSHNLVEKAVDAAGITSPTESAVETGSTWTGFDEPLKVRHRKGTSATWTFTDYAYDENGNVKVRRENGEESTTGTQSKAPRRYELTHDAADWLTQQLDLGVDSACKDDQRIVNAFWSTGWEKQRDIYRASATCVADPTTWPKKQTTSWDHLDNGKLKTLVTKNSAGTVTESHTVGYETAGIYANGSRVSDRYVLNRASTRTGVTTCLAAAPCDAVYEYDARDRLLRHQVRAGKDIRYTLDQPTNLIGDTTVRAGNVTTENRYGTVTTRRYTGNRLTSATVGTTTTSFWYDPLGNLDCVTLAAGSQANCSPSGTTGSSNLVTDYTYDYLSRLASQRSFAAGAQTDKADYVHDALDRTVSEVEDHASTGKDRSTAFTYQGLSSLVTREEQTGGTNAKVKTYSYDAYGHQLSMSDQVKGSTTPPEQFSYSHDVHGSVSQLISDAGSVRASYGYDAYGGPEAPDSDTQSLTTGDPDNQTPLNPFRFSAKRMDSGTATSPSGTTTLDMGARRFGPNTGRFQQPDVYFGALANLGLSTDPLTQNRYSLAGTNPVSFVEIDGHVAIADGGGGAATTPSVIGAAAAPQPGPGTGARTGAEAEPRATDLAQHHRVRRRSLGRRGRRRQGPVAARVRHLLRIQPVRRRADPGRDQGPRGGPRRAGQEPGETRRRRQGPLRTGHQLRPRRPGRRPRRLRHR